MARWARGRQAWTTAPSFKGELQNGQTVKILRGLVYCRNGTPGPWGRFPVSTGVFGEGQFFSEFDGFDGVGGPPAWRGGRDRGHPTPVPFPAYVLPLQCLCME